LSFPSGMETPVLPYSLLHPSFETPFTPSSRSSSPLSVMESTATEASHSSTSESSSSQSGLLQLANIISTFG
jgi:hypothetical protein